MTLLVQPFEFFGGLVQLDLRSLRLSHFLLQLGCLLGHLHGQLLNLEGQFFDFGLICTSVLLQRQVVFLLLASGQSPLLQLFLIPVHFELELVHAFIRLEDHVLNVVQSVLLVCNALLQLFNFVLQSAALALSHLLEVLLSLDFLVLGVHETLRVHQFHLDRLEMLLQNFEAFLMLFDLQAELSYEAHFFAHDLVQLLVLIVGVRGEVVVQVILSNGVHNVVGHLFFFFLIFSKFSVTRNLSLLNL